MRLDTYQKLWNKALNSKAPLGDIAADLGIKEERLSLYRNFITQHYLNSLKKMFPRVTRIYNAPWEKWGEEYYRKFPPKEWELNDLCKHFSDFMHTKAKKGEIPLYIAELTSYEWSEFSVFKDETPVPEKSRELHLSPYLRIHLFEHDIPGWVINMEKNLEQNPTPKKATTILFIARDLHTHNCTFTKGSMLSSQIILHMQEVKELNEKRLIKTMIDKMSEYDFEIDDNVIKSEIDFLKKQAILI